MRWRIGHWGFSSSQSRFAGDRGRCEIQIQMDKIIQCELLAANLMPLVIVIALDIGPVVTALDLGWKCWTLGLFQQSKQVFGR